MSKNINGKRIKITLEMSEYMALNLAVFLYGAASGRNSDEQHIDKRMRTNIKKIALKIQKQAESKQ